MYIGAENLKGKERSADRDSTEKELATGMPPSLFQEFRHLPLF